MFSNRSFTMGCTKVTERLSNYKMISIANYNSAHNCSTSATEKVYVTKMEKHWLSYISRRISVFILLIQLIIIGILVNRNSKVDNRIEPISLRRILLSKEIVTSADANTSQEIKGDEESYAATNRFWVNHIREYCGLNKDKLVSFPNHQMVEFRLGLPVWVWMTSSHHQLFYCAAHKCSSTTWKTYLLDDSKIQWQGNPHL